MLTMLSGWIWFGVVVLKPPETFAQEPSLAAQG